MIIRGRYPRIIFHNEETDYTVMSVLLSDNKKVTITGEFNPNAFKDSRIYEFEVSKAYHKTYGEQFVFEASSEVPPKTADELSFYLFINTGLDGSVSNVLLSELGEDAYLKLLKDPNCVDTLPLDKEDKDCLKKEIEAFQLRQNKDAYLKELTELGLGVKASSDLISWYGPRALEVIKEKPYATLLKLKGVKFPLADKIALSLGTEPNSPVRLKEKVIYELNQLLFQSKSTYIDEDNFNKHLTCSYVSKEELLKAKEELIREHVFIKKDTLITTETFSFLETETATYLSPLITQKKEEMGEDVLSDIEVKLDTVYSESQKEALLSSLSHAISIITGGPGTGKTTVVKALAHLFSKKMNRHIDEVVTLLAPTGRAARRLGEAVGLPAYTIHSALKITPQEDEEQIKKGVLEDTSDEEEVVLNPVIIIDESSMLDVFLMYEISKHIKPHHTLIFVGDKDQIPSIRPGNVFIDLIESNQIPVSVLTEVFRQKEGSHILDLAYHIKDNTLPQDIKEHLNDRIFFDTQAVLTAEYCRDITLKLLNDGFTLDQMQILAPMYKTDAGIDRINTLVKNAVNPDNLTLNVTKSKAFSVGDKVMYTENDYEIEVFNGDIGFVKNIVDVDGSRGLLIQFPNKEVAISEEKIKKHLTLAYAISIHKAQGSEFPLVILPVVPTYNFMLSKNLVYTAVTRASKYLILLGDTHTLLSATRKEELKRTTQFKEALASI